MSACIDFQCLPELIVAEVSRVKPNCLWVTPSGHIETNKEKQTLTHTKKQFSLFNSDYWRTWWEAIWHSENIQTHSTVTMGIKPPILTFQVAALSSLFHCALWRVNHSNNAIVKPPEMTPQAAAKELESVMRRVREAQSTIAAAIEPGDAGPSNLLSASYIDSAADVDSDTAASPPKADTRKRSTSRSRKSRRSRSRSHSRSRTRRKRSRSKHRCHF